MNCLKCGAGTTAQNVFCEACQKDMARHPIPKDAVAVLPNREHRDHAPRKNYTKPNAEQQVMALGRQLRRQRIAIWILSVVCALLLAAGAYFGLYYGKDHPIIGQNYNSTTVPSSTLSLP